MQTEGSELCIAYLDDALLVLEKPAGLLSVPGRGADKQDCLSARVQRIHGDALVVHRLDMATSGLMLMARGKTAQLHLNRAFASGAIHKRYQALVHGCLAAAPGGWGLIDLPIALDWPNRPRRSTGVDGGKASATRWKPLGKAPPGQTRLELEPVTGRSHQLRVHLLAIGHPIVGDTLYGPADGANRLMLHATQLRFTHPVSGQPMRFESTAAF